MKITRIKLRKLIREALTRGIVLEVAQFASTASEEAAKINREAGVSIHTDQAYWEEMGIHTGEDLARSLMISNYSDTYKSMHGIRPRWVRFEDMSFDEIQVMVKDLYEEEEEGHKEDPDARWMDERHHDEQDDWGDEERGYQDQEEWEAMRDEAAAEEEEEIRMTIPEEGEEFPKQVGMGRGRGISEVTRKQLKRIIKEEYKSFLCETRHRRPWNYRHGSGSQWYSQPDAWEHYDQVVRDVSRWFADDEEIARNFLSDVMFMGFDRAAQENNIGGDAEGEVRMLLVNSGYLNSYGGWQLPDEDYPKILGYTDPVTGEAIKINVQTPNDMDDILDPILRRHPDLKYSID